MRWGPVGQLCDDHLCAEHAPEGGAGEAEQQQRSHSTGWWRCDVGVMLPNPQSQSPRETVAGWDNNAVPVWWVVVASQTALRTAQSVVSGKGGGPCSRAPKKQHTLTPHAAACAPAAAAGAPSSPCVSRAVSYSIVRPSTRCDTRPPSLLVDLRCTSKLRVAVDACGCVCVWVGVFACVCLQSGTHLQSGSHQARTTEKRQTCAQ